MKKNTKKFRRGGVDPIEIFGRTRCVGAKISCIIRIAFPVILKKYLTLAVSI